jgi:glutamate racemase
MGKKPDTPMADTNTMKKTILVTDSGLGGLSVFTNIAAGLAKASLWPNVTMIYFNAWPEQTRGYNHQPDMAAKARVFNNALKSMNAYEPDMILIACNTLSVIYPFTGFSRTTAIPVTGIVNHGIEMIAQALENEPESCVIVFGTPTTADARSHALGLIKKGIAKHRIISQGCVDLAGKIERNPFGHEVEQLVRENVVQAVQQVQQGGKKFTKVFAALCCTHFGYCKDLFKKHLEQQITAGHLANGHKIYFEILNPNERMAQKVLTHEHEKPFKADINMQIVSRVEWEASRIDAYEQLLQSRSQQVVLALKQYELNPELFEV